MMTGGTRLTVGLEGRAYDILVGTDLLARAGGHMRPLLAQPRVIVVSDENVAPLYMDTLADSLAEAGVAHKAIVLPAGEPTKDFDHLRHLIDGILESRVERGTTLVALGGGVIGDITGFAAAITLRGLDCVQIPTTLLAQVDSSVGGKTGINTAFGKNLVGSFHQPRLVLADVGTLRTLPHRQLLAGYGETVKCALIDDAQFFAQLEKEGPDLCAGNADVQSRAVVTCCTAKAAIVADDERETGRRALLNLGHTFGHALETQAGYGEALLHGEAVAIGTAMAFDLSVRLGLCPPADGERVRNHLRQVGLSADLGNVADSSWTAEALMNHMALDKKVTDGRVTFVLARGIGAAFMADDVESGDVKAVLETYLAR
jgi:3-dehydroquinate synthase